MFLNQAGSNLPKSRERGQDNDFTGEIGTSESLKDEPGELYELPDEEKSFKTNWHPCLRYFYWRCWGYPAC